MVTNWTSSPWSLATPTTAKQILEYIKRDKVQSVRRVATRSYSRKSVHAAMREHPLARELATTMT